MLRRIVSPLSNQVSTLRRMLATNFTSLEIRSLMEWKERVADVPGPILLCCYAPWCEVSNSTVQTLEKEAEQAKGKWTLALLNVDEQAQLRDALQLTKVPALFLIEKGFTVDRLVRDSLQTDLRPFLSSVRLRSGQITAEGLLIEKINEAYEAAESGLHETAIERYSELLETAGEKYELTCLVALTKEYLHKRDYAHAELHYKRMKAKYGLEMKANPEVAAVCKEVEAAINSFQASEESREKYLALRAELLESSYSISPDLDTRLKLASLDFDYGNHTQAFETVLGIIEEEGTLEGAGYDAFREMCDVLGPDNGHVRLARTQLSRLRTKLRS